MCLLGCLVMAIESAAMAGLSSFRLSSAQSVYYCLTYFVFVSSHSVAIWRTMAQQGATSCLHFGAC